MTTNTLSQAVAPTCGSPERTNPTDSRSVVVLITASNKTEVVLFTAFSTIFHILLPITSVPCFNSFSSQERKEKNDDIPLLVVSYVDPEFGVGNRYYICHTLTAAKRFLRLTERVSILVNLKANLKKNGNSARLESSIPGGVIFYSGRVPPLRSK